MVWWLLFFIVGILQVVKYPMNLCNLYNLAEIEFMYSEQFSMLQISHTKFYQFDQSRE